VISTDKTSFNVMPYKVSDGEIRICMTGFLEHRSNFGWMFFPTTSMTHTGHSIRLDPGHLGKVGNSIE